MLNPPLVIAGTLSFLASITHIIIIFGGAQWYRFFGAGEEMATLAEQGSLLPALITAGIALVLFIWGLYAYSGAGLIGRLPLLKLFLSLITLVFIVRAAGGLTLAFSPTLLLDFFPNTIQAHDFSVSFLIWSSVICSVFGIMYLSGTIKGWPHLSPEGE